MRPPQRAVVDDHVDRPQVEASRDVEPSGTNGPRACAPRRGDAAGKKETQETQETRNEKKTDAGPAARPGLRDLASRELR